MNKYTDQEIIDKCQEIWNADHKEHYSMGWEPEGCVSIESNTDEKVAIRFACMYEAPNLNLNVLMKLADFLGTKNINDGDKFSYGGCETCDYGSSYGFTLTARPE